MTNTAEFSNGYGLVIGVANYPKVRKLPNTILKDARDVAQVIRSPLHCSYPDDHVRLLLDGEATAQGIRDGLRWLASSTGADDTALVFFSGHGGRIEQGPGQDNYLIPYDCDPRDLKTTAISGSELTELLREIRAQRLLVLFDCCYSGGTGEAKDLGFEEIAFKDGFREQYYEKLAQGTGRVIMASSRPDEVSLVLPGMDNSLFTHYLLEALNGKARTRADGLIRVFDLFEYVSEEVPAQAAQHPIFKASDLDKNFPIALFEGGKRVAAGSPAAQPLPTRVNRRELREVIVQRFTMADLELMCDDIEEALREDNIKLQVDLELFGGGGRPVIVRRLIEYLDNRQYLSYLVSAVRRERPGII